MCCGSYRGRLRAIKLFLWLHGSAEYIKMGLWRVERLKDVNSTVAKRGSVLIGVMTPDGAIWFRYQRAVLMR